MAERLRDVLSPRLRPTDSLTGNDKGTVRLFSLFETESFNRLLDGYTPLNKTIDFWLR